jgi:hypothetical protein
MKAGSIPRPHPSAPAIRPIPIRDIKYKIKKGEIARKHRIFLKHIVDSKILKKNCIPK